MFFFFAGSVLPIIGFGYPVNGEKVCRFWKKGGFDCLGSQPAGFFTGFDMPLRFELFSSGTPKSGVPP
jgi:hypothetical protein